MVQAHHLLKLAGQDPQQTRLQDLSFLPHNLSKGAMVPIRAISNRAMVSTAVRLAANMLASVELGVTKPLDKVTRTANMEATKHLLAIIMAIANNVADGVATTDTN